MSRQVSVDDPECEGFEVRETTYGPEYLAVFRKECGTLLEIYQKVLSPDGTERRRMEWKADEKLPSRLCGIRALAIYERNAWFRLGQ